MRKSLSVIALSALLAMSGSVFADSGIFGTGVTISSSISGTASLSLYEITLIGDGRLNPNTGGGGVTLGAPTLVPTGPNGGTSSWATTLPATGGSLGTFVSGSDTLTLDGGEQLTFKNGGSNVSGAHISYSIDGGSFTSITMAFNEDNVSGNSGDQRWYTDGANVNLLTGLSSGTHTLSVFFEDDNTDRGHDFISNGANNYNVSFTVVPEPSTMAMIIAPLLGGGVFLARRRRKA